MLGKLVIINSLKEQDTGVVINEHLGSNGIECRSLIDSHSFFVLRRDIIDIDEVQIFATRSHAVLCWYTDPEECFQPSEGKIHRDNDEPAILWLDGTKEWWQNGYRHRNGDKPAVIRYDGEQEWYQYGTLHRLDGPARITTTYKEYWERGKLLARYKI